MNEIIYSTPEQQIEKLLSQNLIIEDPEYAKQQLQLYGYSNLIKSYRDPYTITIDGKKVYRNGVSFEQIESLYILDKNLRNAVMSAMLDFEEHIKESAADVIASSFGTNQDQYLQFRNYRDKKRRKNNKDDKFTLSKILEKLRDTLNTDKNPIAYYAKVHGTVPPWILFKSIYFGTMANFIQLFKPEQKKMLTERLYEKNDSTISQDNLNALMIDTLFICYEYRNIAAHGGRIYNHNARRKLTNPDLNANHLHGFSVLLLLLRCLKYSSPYDQLKQSLDREINRHCNLFPEDTTYLSQILNINIHSSQVVWLSKKSNKYHMYQHCSGIKSTEQTSLERAIEEGYSPCKKCCR